MNLEYRRIRQITLLYITLPIVIFLIGYLKWYWAILFTLLMIYATFLAFKDKTVNGSFTISKRALIGIVIIALMWCFIGGQGGYFYQSSDFNIRNAIFRDLIERDWPVVYPKNDLAMVYYIGHWMVPALIGKIFVFVGGNNIGWLVGNFALFIWTTVGIILVALLIIKVVGVQKTKAINLVLLIFILFSGLDVVGIILQSITNGKLIVPNHIEWWATFAQYSSITTCLFWVFNQAIVAWLIILLYLNGESIKNYAFLGFSCLLYAPLPFLGIIPYFIARAVMQLGIAIKRKEILAFGKLIFSMQNMIALFTIFPIMFLFYTSNSMIDSAGVQVNNNVPWGIGTLIVITVLFIFFEFAFYAIVIYKENKKNLDYYVCVGLLCAILVLKIGSANDFTMRVSIPSIMVLMILVIKSLLQVGCNTLDNQKSNISRYKKRILIILLLMGAVTPMVEFTRAVSTVIEQKRLGVVADDIKTLSNEPLQNISNFVTDNPMQKEFFMYLAK